MKNVCVWIYMYIYIQRERERERERYRYTPPVINTPPPMRKTIKQINNYFGDRDQKRGSE